MAGWTPDRVWAAVRRARLVRVLIVYGGTSFAVLQALDILTDAAGLPSWVVPGGLALLLVGLPIIVATALVQSAPEATPPASVRAEPSPGPVSTEEGAAVARRWLTWRRAILGGVLAFALLGVVTAATMTMRALGIGPTGTLVAQGVLERDEPILLAEFGNLTGDSALSVVATEALRIDLAQSSLVSLLPPDRIAQALARMERPPGVRLDRTLARELAIREGLKAFIAGEIAAVGGGYVIAVELLEAESGRTLTAFRETARDPDGIVRAIDGLSRKLRERIGESLRSIRGDPPLARVTTGSLEALTRYSQAMRAIEVEGNMTKGIALLEEAATLDTLFAMAYQQLGEALFEVGQRAQAVAMFTRAYEHRGRLTERERYMTTGRYHQLVEHDLQRSITAYTTLLDAYPDDNRALLYLAQQYLHLRDYERAEEVLRRGTAADPTVAVCYACLIFTQVLLGKLEEAEMTLQHFEANVPGNPEVAMHRAYLASDRGEYEEAEAVIRSLRAGSPERVQVLYATSGALGDLALVRGRLAEARDHWRDALAVLEELGASGAALVQAMRIAEVDVRFRGDAVRGLGVLEAALARHPLDSLPPLDRPYISLAQLYARAGRVDLARRVLGERDEAIEPRLRQGSEPWRHVILAEIAMAEGRFTDAITGFERAEEGRIDNVWRLDLVFRLARAHDAAGHAEAAIAGYERYLTMPWHIRVEFDAWNRALAYERLAALLEDRDPERAASYRARLAELWRDADPELRAQTGPARGGGGGTFLFGMTRATAGEGSSDGGPPASGDPHGGSQGVDRP